VNPKEIKEKIEMLKLELSSLIDKGAGFSEVYSISTRLDKLIVMFYKYKLGEIQ
jgi:hypothetical protein